MYNRAVKRGKGLAVPILLLVGAAILPLWKHMLGREMFFLSDAFYQHYPWQAILSQLLSGAPGRLPTWNPAMFCGTPVMADPQFQALYPPALFYRFLPFAQAYGCYLAFHGALAVSGMAVFLLARGLNTRAVAIGSLGFGLGAHPSLLASMPPVLAAYAWLPWVAYFAGKLAGNPGISRAIALAIALSWLALAGSPQYALYAVILAGVIIAGDSPRGTGPAYKWGGLAVLTAVGIAAAWWIPFAAYLPETTRAGAVPIAIHRAGSLAPWHVLTLLTPFSFMVRSDVPVLGLGSLWLTMHFIGVAALALAVAAYIWMRNDNQVKGAAMLVGLGLVLAMAAWIPGIGPVFTAIPPFSLIRHDGLAMGLVDFGLAWLAAVGASEAEKRINGPAGRKFLDYLVLTIVFLGTIGGVTRVMLGWFKRRMGYSAGLLASDLGSLLHPAMSLSLLALLVWLARRREIKAAQAFTAVAILSFLELAMVRTALQPSVDPAWLMEASATEKAIIKDSAGTAFWRIAIAPRHQEFWMEEGNGMEEVSRNIRASFRSNLPAAAGFRDIEGNNPLRPAALSSTIYAAQGVKAPWVEPARGILSDLGARYVISRGRIPGDGWPVIHEGHVFVYRNPGARSGPWVSSGTGTVRSVGKPVPGEWTLECDMSGPGIIGISERASRGWKLAESPAGARLTTVRWGVLLGVAVPAGRHKIRLSYDPPAVKIGLGLGFIVLVMLASWGAVSIFRDRKAGNAG